eukprot:749761-Hanusia_phi.AAC.1
MLQIDFLDVCCSVHAAAPADSPEEPGMALILLFSLPQHAGGTALAAYGLGVIRWGASRGAMAAALRRAAGE